MFRQLRIAFFILLIAGVQAGCEEQPPKKPDFYKDEVNWWIKPVRIPCVDAQGPRACLHVSAAEEYGEYWELLYGKIEGFDFETNVVQRIHVGIEQLDPKDVPEDASPVRYWLIDTLVRENISSVSLHDIYALERFDLNEISAERPDQLPRLELNLTRDSIYGFDGCSEFSAALNLTNDTGAMLISDLTRSDSTCMQVGGVPGEFVRRLVASRYAQRDGLKLYLFDGEYHESMTFRKID